MRSPTPIAIPAHVGDDGIWLEFIAPTGKRCAINLSVIAVQMDGITGEALDEWAAAQYAMHAAQK